MALSHFTIKTDPRNYCSGIKLKQHPLTEEIKKINKSLVQKQPSAVLAEAVNRLVIKRDCYCHQAMETDIKILS